MYNQTIVINAGETFNLEASVEGKPIPTAQWFKGNLEVENSARAEIRNTDFKALLVVKDAIRVDGGQYTLVLTNVAGSKTIPFSVKVLDRPGPSEGPLTISNVTEEKCSLSWLPPRHDGGASISHYIIQKRETSRLAWTVVCSDCKATMFKVTKLLKGNEYIFRVMAVNKYGTGEPLESAPVIMRNPFVPPGAPQDLEITNITRDSMTVCWNRPETSGGSDIVGYIVEKRDRAGVRWTKCNKRRVTDLRFRVTGLTEDHEYEFRISAENAAGVGQPSPSTTYLKACDPTFEPGCPTNVHVVDTTRDSISLAWHRPIYDGGCEIQGYAVEITKADEEEWAICTPPCGVNATKFTIKKLIEHQEYKVRICAINKVGVGEPTEIQGVVKPVDKIDPPEVILDSDGSKSAFINVRVLDSPSAPTNLGVKDVKRNSVSLSWEPPLIDGGAKISHYIVEKREQKRMAFTSVCTNSVNELGVGLPASTDQVKVSEPPLPPGKIVVVDITRHAVTLSWEKPDHDGGSKITNYIVEMQPKGDDKWTVCSEVKALEATIDGLTTGEEYSFRVTAVNDKGRSDAKPLATPVVVRDITMEPIINLLFTTYSVKAGDDLKIDVPFKSRPQPEVCWKKDGQVLKQTTRVNVLNSKTSSKIVIKDATKEDVGKYVITLTNSVGTKSAEISVIILDKPGPPSNIKVDEVSADFISLSWDPPTYDGGCQINNYVVEKRDTTTTTWQIVSATVARTSIKVSRLTQGTEYQFRIAAENRYGKSPAIDSAPVVAQYPFEPPGPPTQLHVVHATKTGMLVVWGRPASDGGSPVIGYHIESKDQSSILWTKVNRGLVTENQFKMTGMEEGLLYQFRVYAENIAGIGPCTRASDPVAARDPCESPHNLRVTNITRNSVSLFWERPEYDGSAKITGYIVERQELPTGRWLKCNFTNVQDTYFDVTGLTEDVRYDFRVIAKNSAEQLSAPSESTGPVTVKDDVDPPTIILEDKFRQLVVIKAGEIIRIDAEITGRPLPVVSWSKDGKEIEAKARCEITSTNFTTTLIVKDAIRRDSGQYVLTLVFAENTAGLSAPSTPCPLTRAEDPQFLPSPPAKPRIIDSTKTTVTLSWNKPLFDGGAPVTGYRVEYRKTLDDEWIVGVQNTKNTEFTVVGLSPGTEYVFVVKSINKIGVSEPSPESDKQVAKEREEEPTFDVGNEMRKTLIVKDGSSFTMKVPFKGKPIPSVTWAKPDVDLRVRAVIDTTDTFTSITLEKATRNDSGKYTVTLSNVAGTSSLTLTVRVLDSPGPPSHIEVKEVTKTSATITWDIPEIEGGGPVKNYLIDYREASKKGWTRLTDTCHRLTYKVADLQEGEVYYFRVTGENEYGIGVPAETKEGTKITGIKS
uniref:Titin n=1 Tax=Haplochromis burtoni TaxID=8153 RepID=A0A3Q2WIR1_HAPBU